MPRLFFSFFEASEYQERVVSPPFFGPFSLLLLPRLFKCCRVFGAFRVVVVPLNSRPDGGEIFWPGWKASFVYSLEHGSAACDDRPTRGGVMNNDDVLKQFDRLNIWKQGDQRAPHKPLLVLYALGRWQQGQTEVSFRTVEKDLTGLLREFGRPRTSDHPEQPYWRLQNDGVWTVQASDDLPRKIRGDIPTVTALRSHDVRAGFSEVVKAALTADPSLLVRIATSLLERHFPESIHPDILSAVGLSLTQSSTEQKRDPQFRHKVLTAYQWRCAVCGFDVRLGSVSIALDAAHIRWHQYGGPAAESNGFALCVLHHRTFDLGAFTVNHDGVLLVSDQANGSTGFQEALLRHHGQKVYPAQRPEWSPGKAFLDWHGKEVFKGSARHLEILA